MYGLFFEVKPKDGHLKNYLSEVDYLNPILSKYPGLKWIDRFSNLSDKDFLLSFQIWDSEESILSWRQDPEHQKAQMKGKKLHFDDYRIRVGKKVVKYESRNFNYFDEEKRKLESKYIVLINSTNELQDTLFTSFKSINREYAFTAIASTLDFESASKLISNFATLDAMVDATIYEVLRDYSMYDRDQSPN